MGTLLLVIAGCGGSKDVCDGVSGTCVSLTVQSKTITAIEGLHIVSSGAIAGTHDTTGPSTSLPLHVALQIPAMLSGAWILDIDATSGGDVLGSCVVETTITAGKHTTAICDLIGDNADLAGLDLTGADLTGADLSGVDASTPFQCDPSIATGATACVWRWQTPMPQGDDLISVVALADNDTFAFTTSGLILHRDNATWTPLTTRPANPYRPVSLFGAGNDLYISGTGYKPSTSTSVPVVFHSPDKGITWAQETLPLTAAVDGCFATEGFASNGNNVVVPSCSGNYFVRSNGGVWTLQTTGTITFNGGAAYIGSMMLVGNNGTTGTIAYSSDGGASFTAASLSSPPLLNQLNSGCIASGGAQTGYWAVGNGTIWHATGPTPSTFTQQPSAAFTGIALQGCAATDDLHAWAWGGSSVFVTTNGGTSWAAVATPPNTTKSLQAGGHSPSGGSALTIVGDAGVIFRATDGNTFAAELKGLQDPLNAIHGVAPGVLFAVGQAGAIYRTVDDGANWTKLTIPAQSGTTADLNAVWGSSATDIYATGSLGGAAVIMHSSDGMTFTKYVGSLPANTALNDVWGSSANGVFAVGAKGTGTATQRLVLRTVNQGSTWAEVPIIGFTDTMGSTNLAFSTFSLGTDVWVTGFGGLLFHSGDGINFTAQSPGVGMTGIGRIRGIAGHLIATLGTDPGYYIESANAGATWTLSPPAWGAGGNWLAFTPNEDRIFAVTPSAAPAYTLNKGATWKPLSTGIIDEQNKITNIFAFAANDVFAIGPNGIIHYGN